MARDLIYAVVGLVLVAGVCTGCRAQAQVAATGGGAAAADTTMTTTGSPLPPQLKNWAGYSNGTNIFPGHYLTIRGSVAEFTRAGPFVLRYAKTAKSYLIFKIVKQPKLEARTFNRVCYKVPAEYIGFHLTKFPDSQTKVLQIRIFCQTTTGLADADAFDMQISYAK